MSNEKRLIFTGESIRIDKRLAQSMEYSRNFFEHLFKRKAIKVITRENQEKEVKKSYKLHDGDQIIIDNLERFIDGGILEEAAWIDLEVLHETEDYMVIYKKKGVLSHPNSIRDVSTPSVVAWAYNYEKGKSNKILPSTGNFIRAGLIHRLDKETDGCMVIAKNEKGLAHFKNLFQKKSTAHTKEEKEKISLKKYYRAICDIEDRGEEFIKVTKREGYPYYIEEEVIPKVPNPIIKVGITKILGLKVENGKAFVDIEILTGRTHQIRYHLSQKGLPIVGDYLYNSKHIHEKEVSGSLGLSSTKIEFEDPLKKYITISSPGT